MLPSMPGSSKWSLFPRFPHQKPVYTSPLTHTCYMPRPSHSSSFDHPNNISLGVHIIKLPNMQFSPFPCYLVPLGPKNSPQTQFSNTLSLHFSLDISDQVSHPYTTGKIIFLHILIFKFLDNRHEGKRFCKHSLTSNCSSFLPAYNFDLILL